MIRRSAEVLFAKLSSVHIALALVVQIDNAGAIRIVFPDKTHDFCDGGGLALLQAYFIVKVLPVKRHSEPSATGNPETNDDVFDSLFICSRRQRHQRYTWELLSQPAEFRVLYGLGQHRKREYSMN